MVRPWHPATVTLAQDGPAALRDRYDLIYRPRAAGPHALWQADQTLLDSMVLDANGEAVRPWLTIIRDDYARAVAGYTIFLGAPTALQTALALRQALGSKQHAAWPVCGIPDGLHVDHGSDVTSTPLEQVAADLHCHLVYATVGRPQGRGKGERLFGTLHTAWLAALPGYLRQGPPAPPPRLSLPELDATIGAYCLGLYHTRPHRATGLAPIQAWLGLGWLPRLPESLEEWDLLLVMVAKPRMVRRDGGHCQGLRYIDPTLAVYVGEPVTIRYDPRDLADIRGLHRNRFLCRAIHPAHAGRTVTLKDMQTARVRHRRALRTAINARRVRVADFLPDQAPRHPPPEQAAATHRRSAPKLSTYVEAKRCPPVLLAIVPAPASRPRNTGGSRNVRPQCASIARLVCAWVPPAWATPSQPAAMHTGIWLNRCGKPGGHARPPMPTCMPPGHALGRFAIPPPSAEPCVSSVKTCLG